MYFILNLFGSYLMYVFSSYLMQTLPFSRLVPYFHSFFFSFLFSGGGATKRLRGKSNIHQLCHKSNRRGQQVELLSIVFDTRICLMVCQALEPLRAANQRGQKLLAMHFQHSSKKALVAINLLKLIEPYHDVSCPGLALQRSGYVCIPDYYDTCVMRSISYTIEEVPRNWLLLFVMVILNSCFSPFIFIKTSLKLFLLF